MARDTEDNKTVAITVNYKEERGTITVNNVELKNGQSLSVKYGSSVSVTVIPSKGYSCNGSSLKMTPQRNISEVHVINDTSPYNTNPMTFVFNDFAEDMIFDFLFYKLYNASIEVRYDGQKEYSSYGEIDSRILDVGKREISLRYIRGIEIKFASIDDYYLKQVLIDGADKTSEINNNRLKLDDPPKNIIIEYARVRSIFVSYNKGGMVKLNDQSVTSGNSISVDASTDVRVAIIPDEGYHIKQVKLGTTDVTGQVSDNVLLISSISEDKEITVTFDPITYAVKVIYSGKGRVEVNSMFFSSGKVYLADALTDVRVKIIPHSGARIEQVMLGDENITDKLINNVLTIPSISADKEIKITFFYFTYTLTVTYSEGGTVLVNDNVSMKYKEFASGQSATFGADDIVDVWISPKTGYRVKQVLLGNMNVTDEIENMNDRGKKLRLRFSSSNLEDVVDQDIMAVFEKITYAVKVTCSEGGSVQVNGQSIVSENAYMAEISTDVKVIIKPQSGYRIKQILLDGQDMTKQFSEDNVLTIPSISSNKEIVVTFEKDTYSFRANYYGDGGGRVYVNGSLVPNGNAVILPAGSKVEIELLLYEGFYITTVKLGSTDITNQVINNKYTIPALSANSFLSVTFEKIPTYFLNINMEGGYSSIKINDEVITSSTLASGIKAGCSISFQSNKYYDIKKVTLGDKDITDQIQNGSYTIESIESNLTLKIEYVHKQYTLSVNLQGTDKIQINRKEVTNGSSIITYAGMNSIDISSEYYLIKQVLLDDEIVYQDNSEVTNSISFVAFIEANIDNNKELTIIVKLREKRELSLELKEAGTLASLLSEEDARLVTDLNVTGKIDQRDFVVMNQMQSLFNLSLDWATIEDYGSYPANTIPEKAFYNNKNINMLYLPHSIETIAKQAFLGSNIYTFRGSAESYKYLTKIGEEAFKDCQYLIEVPSIYNIPVIEKGVFENCSNLTSLSTILSNLVEIKESAFRNCKNLSITLEGNLERIGDYAFENVKEVNISGESKLSHIGTNALRGCQTSYFDFSNSPYLKELPSFEGCSNMNSITFPPNVKEIPAGIFKGCISLGYISMNENIESIADNAFSDSRSITYLYVPVNEIPEVSSNSFNEFHYDLAKLVVPVDYLSFYKDHAVWGKFKSIEPWGTATYRQFEVLLSKGGRIELNKTYSGDNNFWLMANTLLFPTSSCMEVHILPDERYSIESVRLNGENITNTLDENNTCVIPNLMVDSQFEVKFKENNTTGFEMINTGKRIYLSGTNQLSLSGFRIGARVFVYDASGRMITHTTICDSVEKISLPGRGIYFLLVDKESVKIVF